MDQQLGQAAAQVNGIYNPAIQSIQGQLPAIQELYSTLMSGLTGQVGNQQQFLDQSAAQRGVGSVGLSQGNTGILNDALAIQQAQLGSQQAQDLANVGAQYGKTLVNRGQSTYDLANSLQQQALESQSNQQKLTSIERNAALQQQQNQQDFNVKQAAYQAAQARAAAAKAAAQKSLDLTTISKDQLTRELRLLLKGVKGKDGHVSPENLAKAYNTWQQAGLDAPSFWKNYQGLWNSKQKNYGDQFHYFVSKGV